MQKYKVFKEEKKGIIQAGVPEAPYYTNSSQLPVGFTNDVFEAMELQDDLQCKYTGGCVEKGNYVFCVDEEGAVFAVKIEELYEKFQVMPAATWRKHYKVISYNPQAGRIEVDNIVEAVKIDVSAHNKIRVLGENGLNIVTSDWHPFFVRRNNEVVQVRADELTTGDMLVSGLTSTVKMADDVKVIATSKEEVDDNEFYDLTTQFNHNYLCGNTVNCAVFVHNTVFHLYMSERVSNANACKKLVKSALSNFRMPYISVTPTFSTCPIHGYLKGHHDFCPLCDQEILKRHSEEVNPNI